MTNHLINENSPYLLQHASNPVDWYPWSEEALHKAQDEDKPIFLSIGYAACHWCHVMAHESFENSATASLMNEFFVNIKVDREERPDLDNIYMQAVVALTGQGGWPMSVFLTPDGHPFYGGTYYPPEPRYNMPSFQDLLNTIASLWSQDRAKLLANADALTDLLQQTLQDQPTGAVVNSELLSDAVTVLAESYQWKTGGWGHAPKFPHPMALEFTLRQAARGNDTAQKMALHSLRTMARGGMYDVLGGGFARYSVNANWQIPHFEKMLYDNALLARAYLHAYLLSEDLFLREVCENTLDFVLREMTHPEGGFFSSLDADSEGIEGKYYTWTKAELRNAIPDPADQELLFTAFGITDEGDLDGRNCLQQSQTIEQLADTFHTTSETVAGRLSQLRPDLFSIRSERTRPVTDDKVLVSWNALMITSFAEAGRYLQRPDYVEAARKNAGFLLKEMYLEGRLLRSWREEKAQHNAYLEDYASLILGLLALYQTTPDPHWYQAALDLAEDMLTHFSDPDGGFFDTRADHGFLLLRPKDTQDNATPSGSSLAATALLHLAAYQGNRNWHQIAEQMISTMVPEIKRYPSAFGQWLCAADFYIGPVDEVAIIGQSDHPQFEELIGILWKIFRPRMIAAFSTSFPPPTDAPALLQNRSMLEGKLTAYVCRKFVCKQPVTGAAALEALLDQA
ncbi:MAG: thioredoxin domain-containing protein [Anaerolineales bacterium]|nr:thioredoxin domain-containing protein [Anaerolineales bacterium]